MMNNKVILVNSPLYRERIEIKEDYLPPLGLVYLATSLNENDIKSDLLDSIERRMSVLDIVEHINCENPKLLGINIFTVNYDLVKEICENINSNINIVVGGNLTKFKYKDISNWKCNVDIVIGDGEKIIIDIYNESVKEKPIFTTNKSKVYLVNSESIYYVADINKINLDRSYISNEYVNYYNVPEAALITSRGCLYNCAFCGSARSINKEKIVRYRTTENIKLEILSILNNKLIQSIRVLDDLFLRNRHSIIESIKLFENFPQLSWRAMAHILSFSKSEDLLVRLFDSGCKELFIGVESGSQRVRDYINKEGSVARVKSTIMKILDSGISVKAYFILGFPSETMEDLLGTYLLAKELFDYSLDSLGEFRVSVFKFRPYHGTILYNELMMNCDHDIVTNHVKCEGDRNQFNFTSGNYSEVSTKELDEMYSKMINLING